MCTERDYSFRSAYTAPAEGEDGGNLCIVGQKQMTCGQVTFMGFLSITAAEVRKVKCGKNTIQGILTPKKITAMVR